jgi:hypothetical protein
MATALQSGMVPPPYSMQMQTQAMEPGAMFSMPGVRNHAPLPRHQSPYYDQYTEDYEQKLEEQGPAAELNDDGVPVNYVEKGKKKNLIRAVFSTPVKKGWPPSVSEQNFIPE